MADVFVSYSRRDREQIGAIASALEAGGHSLWWDRELKSGEDYGSVIEREIGAAGCVVVAWSKSARDSLWVKAEANEALDSAKLVQVTVDGAKLPLPFTMLHFLDFSRWRGGSEDPLPELDSGVRRMLGGGGRPLERTPGDRPPAEPALQGLAPAVMLGWAALALAILMAAATGAAAIGALPATAFGTLAAFGLALATILLALVTWLVLRVLSASRR
jgi:hypothetical protein